MGVNNRKASNIGNDSEIQKALLSDWYVIIIIIKIIIIVIIIIIIAYSVNYVQIFF